MKVKRNNLTDELMGFSENQTTPIKKSSAPIVINYDQIIEKQAQIIQNLYKECIALRQKINRLKSQQLFSSEHKSVPQHNMSKFAQMIEISLLKQIGSMLEIQQKEISRNKILQTIKRFKWQRQKRSEPIFIEKIKQVRIPVPIEVVVEKPIEKIVIQQKIVQIPVFRQKIVERFITKIQETSDLLFTTSKISSEEQKQKNQSCLQKSDESLTLGTQSRIKQNIPRAQQKKEIKKSQVIEKPVFYRPQKKQYQNFAANKKLTLSDIREDQPNLNKTYVYGNIKDQQTNKSTFNSKGSKQNIKSPKYSKKGQYNKYDYRNEEDNYNYKKRQDYQQKYQKSYYRNSQDNNKTVVSPKYNEKYDKYDPDGYLFDKDKFLDQSKIGNGRNIKRRCANDYYDKCRDR